MFCQILDKGFIRPYINLSLGRRGAAGGEVCTLKRCLESLVSIGLTDFCVKDSSLEGKETGFGLTRIDVTRCATYRFPDLGSN